ncbi:hypothetical protein NGRA_1894 [Nosema granulosis]|uniref:Uncharacterized protein n=1 Tax=Nosema granulosis TaxID=83296 RepID=A0A9P6GXK2_9MICR|nr:hypothetical protein NGRA_1894 [Nosema granulosis]
MIVEGIKHYEDWVKDLNDIYFIGLYMTLLTLLEYISVARYCFSLSLSGIIQLITLKMFHYMFVFGTMIEINVKYYRFCYLGLDILMILYFLKSKDSTISQIFQDYNRKIGADIKVRNSFMVSLY